MKSNKNRINLLGVAAVSLVLAGCGGNVETSASARPTQLLASSTIGAPDYTPIVQQLYISYFGRPADPGGLNSFKGQLAALGGPTDIQKLDQAYHNNAGIRALIDSFGASAESAALYSGDNTAFVTAIYNNVLNRAPDSEGLAFWVGALNSSALTRANASLAIMAGGLANTSVQGRLDASLINKKVTVGSNFTDALVRAPVNGYDGNAAAAKARAMLSTLAASTDVQAFAGTVSSLVDELAAALNPQVPPSLSLYDVDRFFGNDRLSAMPYNATATSNQTLIGSSVATLGEFKLTAKGSNFTITNLAASDSTGHVVPTFFNLKDGQVIAAGTSTSFSLRSPLTNNVTTNLTYSFKVAETGDTFIYKVAFRSN